MYPGTRLAIGPPTDDGFYYDFDTPEPFSDDDLERIEERMRDVIARDFSFELQEYPRDEALEMHSGEPMKLEIIGEIPEGDSITTYRHGEFEDLCAGRTSSLRARYPPSSC